MYICSLFLNVNARQRFSLICSLKKAALPETSSLGSVDIQSVRKVFPDFWKMHFLEQMSLSMSPDKVAMISWQYSKHLGLLLTDLYLPLFSPWFSLLFLIPKNFTFVTMYRPDEEHITTLFFPSSSNSLFPLLFVE